jgi:Ni/Fe-hydrogenase subunit HybB-like protein
MMDRVVAVRAMIDIQLIRRLPLMQPLADDEYCRDPLCSSAHHVNQPGT